MTFYEAALQILTKEGRPLHAREITEIALRDNLLSHVGKQPEQTMASRLAAMARRSHDRRLVAVEPDTFGLVEWNLPASPEALEASGLPEPHDETEPPLRGRERHPRISKENVRIAGRGERRRREEVERKKKRLPPLADLVYELLDRVGRPAPLFDLVASARDRELLGEDIGSEAVEAVLREENERREADGKKTVFEFHDGGFVGLRGRHGAPEEGFDVLPALAAAARDLALEKKPKAAPALAPVGPAPLRGPVAQAVAEQRQRVVKQLRRRLSDLDGPGIEAVAALTLDSMGYRDVRVVKRGKEGALFVGKRRMGLVELRSCIRAIRAGRDLRREDVLELRKEMAAHGAHLGVLVSPTEVTREARSEAVQPGAPVVLLLCGEAFADQLAEKGIGVTSRTVTVVEFDETAFGGLLPKREEKPAEEKRGEEPKERREGEGDERRRAREERREERRRAREERRAARAAARTAAAGEAGAGAAPASAEAGVEGAAPAAAPVVETAAAAGEGAAAGTAPAPETVTPVAPVSPPDEPPAAAPVTPAPEAAVSAEAAPAPEGAGAVGATTPPVAARSEQQPAEPAPEHAGTIGVATPQGPAEPPPSTPASESTGPVGAVTPAVAVQPEPPPPAPAPTGPVGAVTPAAAVQPELPPPAPAPETTGPIATTTPYAPAAESPATPPPPAAEEPAGSAGAVPSEPAPGPTARDDEPRG
jgi:ribonuclease E